jgi:hypothetical protein
MGDDAGLEVADVIGGVVHELDVSDAAPMGLFQALQFSLKEVQPFDIAHNRGLSRRVRRFEIGRGKCAAQAMIGDHLINPGEAVQVILVEFVRRRRSQRGEHSGGVPAENGAVRHVGETCDRQRSGPHALCEIVTGRGARGNSSRAAMGMNVDGDGFAQHLKRGRGRFGCLGGSRRTTRRRAAGQHGSKRSQRRVPHPLAARKRVAMAATIHHFLLEGSRRSSAGDFAGSFNPGANFDSSLDGRGRSVCGALRQVACALFDHFVGRHEQGLRHRQPERFRRLEVDDEVEFGGLQHR